MAERVSMTPWWARRRFGPTTPPPETDVEERLALCRQQIEESPYSHTTAAGWYAEDVPALLQHIETLKTPAWDRLAAQEVKRLQAQVETLTRERDEAQSEAEAYARDAGGYKKACGEAEAKLAEAKEALAAYREFDDVIAALSDARREKYQALQAALRSLRGET